MHEMSAIQSVLRIVLKHAAQSQAQRVVAVKLRIGELSHIADDMMRQYFELMAEATVAQGARLEIARIPPRLRCSSCATEYEAEAQRLNAHCPQCGADSPELIAGREYHVEAIQVE